MASNVLKTREKSGRKLRKNIKPPQNSDEYFERKEPSSQERNHPDAGEVSDVATPMKHSKIKMVYKGPKIKYNPNLPPAAFPTDHSPDFNGLVNDGYQAQDDLAVGSLSDASEDLVTPTMPSSPTPRSRTQHSIRVDTRPVANDDVDGVLSKGTQPSIFEQTMERMARLSPESYHERNMRDMETSDEDESVPKNSSRVISKKSSSPNWDGLSIAHKLDLLDTVYELFPQEDAQQIMNRLRLNESQCDGMVQLLLDRQERKKEEEVNIANSQHEAHTNLLNEGKRRLSSTENWKLAENTLYQSVGKEDYNQSTPSELAKAKSYLGWCGFDPALLNDWKSPTVGKVSSRKRARCRKSDKTSAPSKAQRPKVATPSKIPRHNFHVEPTAEHSHHNVHADSTVGSSGQKLTSNPSSSDIHLTQPSSNPHPSETVPNGNAPSRATREDNTPLLPPRPQAYINPDPSVSAQRLPRRAGPSPHLDHSPAGNLGAMYRANMAQRGPPLAMPFFNGYSLNHAQENLDRRRSIPVRRSIPTGMPTAPLESSSAHDLPRTPIARPRSNAISEARPIEHS